jgi:hypothetical protein
MVKGGIDSPEDAALKRGIDPVKEKAKTDPSFHSG